MNIMWWSAIIFVLIYLAISLEEWLRVSRISLSLLGAGLLWTLYALSLDRGELLQSQMAASTLKVAEIVFFVMSVMALVEWIDGYHGFDGFKRLMVCENLVHQLCRVTAATFFLSSVIDNMTATLLMLTLIKHQFKERQLHLQFVGMIIIASNAGGAWSPIGDVTSSMLWIAGKVSAYDLVRLGFAPALLSCVVPLLIMSWRLWPQAMDAEQQREQKLKKSQAAQSILSKPVSLQCLHWCVFSLGLFCMVSIPWTSGLTGLPPFMMGLFVLGALGVLVDPIMNRFSRYTNAPISAKFKTQKPDEQGSDTWTDHGERFEEHSMLEALRQIDFASVLFIAGLLFCMEMLAHTHVLTVLLNALQQRLGSPYEVVLVLGLLSSVIDNIPLVSGAMNSLTSTASSYGDGIWVFLAYCAGTGGSIFLVGSSSGVVAMGQEGAKFGWYARYISGLALMGYMAGAWLSEVSYLR
jgi:Na+/H+ antiporter NhaD/arsenite permease-like protein